MSAHLVTFCVPADHACLAGHFPGRPIVPGVVLVEQVALEVQALTQARVQHIEQVKFHAPLLPGESAQIALEVMERHIAFRVTAHRHGASTTVASGSLVVERSLEGAV